MRGDMFNFGYCFFPALYANNHFPTIKNIYVNIVHIHITCPNCPDRPNHHIDIHTLSLSLYLFIYYFLFLLFILLHVRVFHSLCAYLPVIKKYLKSRLQSRFRKVVEIN